MSDTGVVQIFVWYRCGRDVGVIQVRPGTFTTTWSRQSRLTSVTFRSIRSTKATKPWRTWQPSVTWSEEGQTDR